MADWSLPTTGSLYTDVITYLDTRLDDAAKQFFSTDSSPSNQPANTIRWNDTSKKWEKWSGATWGDLATTYGITSTASLQLATARTIALSTDVSGSASFSGAANVTITATLATSGVTAATYGSASQVPQITVDAKGRITSATNIALGTLAAQNSNSVSITGGTITGVTLTPTTFTLPSGTGSITEGVVEWNTTTDQLLIGRGATTGTISPDDKATTLTNKTLGASCSFSVDLPVSTGVITTSNTTASLFNTTATTLNIGGAATTINMLATGGKLNLLGTNDSTGTASGALAISGGLGIAKNTYVGGTLVQAAGTSSTVAYRTYFQGTVTFDTANINGHWQARILQGGATTTSSIRGSYFGDFIDPQKALATAYGVFVNPEYRNTHNITTALALGARVDLGATALTGTYDTVNTISALAPSVDAASTKTITNYNGFFAANPTLGALQPAYTRVTGYYSNIANNTGYWNFYAGGTAPNYFNGPVYVGFTSDQGTGDKVQINGTVSASSFRGPSIITAAASADVYNTGATTLNIGGAATTVTIGSTGATIHSLRGTAAMLVPKGTSAQRPTAAEGYVRYNSDNKKLEVYNATAWVSVAGVGKHTIWVPAAAISTRPSNGAQVATIETATNKVVLKTLNFDPATDEFAQFTIRMPSSWDETNLTAQFVWSTSTSDATGNVVWGIQALALSDNEAIDAAFGTAQTVIDAGVTGGNLFQSGATGNIATSAAAGDYVVFQVYRDANDATNDTLDYDARLHGVILTYTTNEDTDA